MTVIVRTTFLQVTVGGTVLTNVLSARVSLGFDLAVAEASVVLASEPTGTSYNDLVQISMGAGTGSTAETPGTDGGDGNVLRFTGLLKQYDRTLFPRSITLVARGPLSRAGEYRNQYSATTVAALQSAGIPGLTVTELMAGTTATDQALVAAALQRVPNLDVDAGNIDGTGTDLGGLPPNALCWAYQETALAFIQKIDAASQGFRTFESIRGVIFRVQISGWPGSGPAEFTFTEGVDIFDGRSTRTIMELKNCARVDGYDFGIGAGIITFSAPGANDIQGESSDNPQEIQFSTSLAGHINSGPGIGFACEDIADYLLAEWNRELVRVTLTTPLDYIIGPGQTHLVQGDGDGNPGRLAVAEALWVQRVDITVSDNGEFSQSITYIGGGLGSGASDDGLTFDFDWATA